MKKIAPAKKLVNSRSLLKIGSLVFLSFFVFFSLAEPLVAQFGSALFIVLGMVLAPLSCQDAVPAEEVPPPPEQVYYASAFNSFPVHTDRGSIIKLPQQPEQSYTHPSALSGALPMPETVDIFISESCTCYVVQDVSLSIADNLFCNRPVRAGPARTLF